MRQRRERKATPLLWFEIFCLEAHWFALIFSISSQALGIDLGFLSILTAKTSPLFKHSVRSHVGSMGD